MEKNALKKLPRGEGSMCYVTRNGIEYICYKKMIGHGTNKKRQAVYGHTQQECIKLMKKAEKEYNKSCSLLNPVQDDNGKYLLKTTMKAWIEERKSNKLKATSFDTIESTYNNHVKDKPIGNLQFSRITSADINKHLKDTKEGGYSLSTVKKLYSLFNQYFNDVYAKDKASNPMLGVESITKKDYDIQIEKDIYDEDDDDIFIETKDGININSSAIILNDEEIKRFVDTASVEFKNGTASWKHGYGLIFIMYSFMRIGEAIALKWKDIDFDNKTVHIYKTASQVKNRDGSNKKTKWIITTTKTESGRRFNLLSDDAMNAIINHFDRISNGRTYEEMKNHYVFETTNGTFATPTNLYRNIKSIYKRANIDDKKVGLHKLRHTGISYYIRHGVPIEIISKMAGHSSIAVTSNIYYDLVDKQFKDAINIMNTINKSTTIQI